MTPKRVALYAGVSTGSESNCRATIPERSAQRIFAVADKILKAGIDRPTIDNET